MLPRTPNAAASNLTRSSASYASRPQIIQIVPRKELRLYAALVKKETDIRKKGLGTFCRAAVKKGEFDQVAPQGLWQMD